MTDPVEDAVRIRPFAPSHQGAVVDLWRRVFPDGPPRNEPASALERKLSVDDLVWVAEADGEVVGVIVAGYDGVRGWIYRLAVDEGHRRRGIGEALMKVAEEGLTRRGCPKVNLQVRGDNAEVVAFYKALGYSVENRVSMGRVLGQ